ncbi:hypothetical protein V1J52_21210 [Streptomyces sp. TRM 70351]|uniref:hypothetical protein n=1 Tax=Streptomyces sp. TRM 70351 TaxID=3116552 RepID=UPI002E7B49D4|nr:hypothetical protein [Streptomyces sp. TRM 70351]MEE1930678.1 hypothetical protein [Streptomyces sp. TRM 70351]
MITYVSSVFGALSGAAARPASSAGRLRLRHLRRSGNDMVVAQPEVPVTTDQSVLRLR